jgi:hypothetical protein
MARVNRLLSCLAAAVVFAGAGVAGCLYEPTVPDGAIRCDELQRCPRGSLCHAVRDGATVLLVCCRTPLCEGAAISAGGSSGSVMPPITPPGAGPSVDLGGPPASGRDGGGDSGSDGLPGD